MSPLLTEIIKEKDIQISPDEATIMCLGIYEDTGSFTFSSTTERDFLAAAFLLSNGANLNVVSDLIARELSPEQVVLLNDMIQASSRYHINGVEIIVTSVTTEKYMPDFAFLVQKMMKMENLDAIFALARMDDKIYVVARSRIDDVDVSGHTDPYWRRRSSLCGGSIRSKAKLWLKQRPDCLNSSYDKIKAHRQAKDLMSSPAITIRLTCYLQKSQKPDHAIQSQCPNRSPKK